MNEVNAAAEADTQGEAIADVEERLSVMFGRIRSVWREAAAAIHPDLQPTGYKILATIVRLGETSASVLTEMLEVDKSLLSRQLRILEGIGLVASHADPKDGRSRVLTPTPDAIERVHAVRMKQQNRLRAALRTRPEHELRSFATMLRLIAEI